ncbi:MAG: hypothetical protein ACXQTI_10050 [Candidatus Nezhaarchaeales archaeon]
MSSSVISTGTIDPKSTKQMNNFLDYFDPRNVKKLIKEGSDRRRARAPHGCGSGTRSTTNAYLRVIK